jgi:hypothetical protein
MDREQEEAVLRITALYVAELEAGLHPRLSDYLARYPQYAGAIADFVAYYHAVEADLPPVNEAAHISPKDGESDEEKIVYMQQRLNAKRARKVAEGRPEGAASSTPESTEAGDGRITDDTNDSIP